MRHVALRNSRKRFGVAIIVATLLASVLTSQANAGSLGSAPCVQTIDVTSGVSVYQDGNSCFVAFKTAGTYSWAPPTGVSKIDLLVVAGGGGGGARHAGGGGAGGVINSTNTTINTSALSVIVGSGGAGGAAVGYAGNEGSNGNNSQVSGGGITTQTAIGGGAGAYGAVSGSGGSSGGGGCCGVGQGTATSGQGNMGSAGFQNGSIYVGGGGGGAGAPGGAGNSSGAGAGGAGQVISWISTASQSNLSIGQNVSSQIYFSGGGGGSTNNVGTAGSGGNGGGGAGSGTTAAGTNGTSNTGGGGGGGGMNGGGAAKGGDGGSGVVVIRYSIPTFSNSATSSIAENTSTSTNAATISVSESSTITIRSALDYSFFTIVVSDSVTARIRFINSPDYEAFADSGANNEYDLTIRATNSSGNYQEFALKITLTDVLESAAITSPALSGAALKGRIVTLTVISNTPGKIQFLIAGKRIPNCLAQPTSGSYPNYSATCTWEPSISGNQRLQALLTPSNIAISSSTSTPVMIFISKRTNIR